MKKGNLCFPPSALVLAVLCLVTPSAQAADLSARFVVANSQIQALGIQTTPLQSQADLVKTGFPAQVVIPPKAEQVISSPLAGLVVQLLVQQNQAVRSGASLVRIASPELGQLQLQLLLATARATLARQAAQREQALFDEGIIPQRRVQEAQAALREGEATLNQARAALRLSGMPSATIERVAASGEPQDSITLAATQAGIVTEITVKPGQRVEASTALLHIAQTDSLWLDIQLPVSENANWPAGTKVRIQDRNVTARILSVSRTVSSTSQTVLLRAAVEGQAGQLRPGEFVTVEMPIEPTQGSWDVPLSAVVHDGDRAYVFVRTADGFEARRVKVVFSARQRVRVQGPVKAGEQIAVSGLVALKGAWLDPKESK